MWCDYCYEALLDYCTTAMRAGAEQRSPQMGAISGARTDIANLLVESEQGILWHQDIIHVLMISHYYSYIYFNRLHFEAASLRNRISKSLCDTDYYACNSLMLVLAVALRHCSSTAVCLQVLLHEGLFNFRVRQHARYSSNHGAIRIHPNPCNDIYAPLRDPIKLESGEMLQ